MIRVVIVDDEPDVIDGLTAVVHWKSLGMELAGTATDGAAGLRLVRKTRPDILLTDIRMAGVDGISLIDHCRKHDPDIVSLIFSGYREFAYAKSAVSLGVIEYLEKPVSLEALEGALRKAAETVRRRDVSRAAKASDERTQRLLAERSFRDLLVGPGAGTDDGLADAARDLGRFLAPGTNVGRNSVGRTEAAAAVEAKLEAVVAVFLAASDGTAAGRMATAIENAYPPSASRRRAHATYFALPNPTLYPDIGELAVLLVAPVRSARNALAGQFERLSRACDPDRELPFVGVGATVQSLSSIYESYRGAKHAARFAAYLERPGISLFEQQDARGTHDTSGKQAATETLVYLIREGNAREAMETLERMLDTLVGAAPPVETMVHECLKLVFAVLQVADETGRDYVEERAGGRVPHAEAEHIITLHDIAEWTTRTVENIIKWIIHIRGSVHNRAIGVLISYMKGHFHEEISLDDLGELLGMNPSYISVIFKQQIGTTFSRYLASLRLERAKLLLRRGWKITECARAVGYPNIQHFSRTFRRLTGRSPSEFRSGA